MRRGDGSLYDIAVPGYKANLSDVLASIALVQLDKLERARARSARVSSRSTTRRSPSSTASRRSRATRATCTRSTSTSCAIDAERAGATRDEYQRALADEHIGTSIHFLPVHRLTWYRERFPSSRRCRSPSAPAPRCCRCRSRPRTRTTDIARRDRRAAARARAVRRHEALRWRDAPRSGSSTLVVTGLALAYILWKIDLAQDVATIARREPRWYFLARARDHGRHRAADGVALAAAARARRRSTTGSPWLVRAYFVVVHRRADPADVDRRRRDAHLRDVAAPSGHGGPVAGHGAARARARRRRDGHARRGRASCSRSAATTSARTSGSRLAFVVATVVLALRALLARARGRCSRGSCRCCARLRLERPLRAVYEAIHAYRDDAAAARRRVRADARACRPCACSRSGLAGKAVGVDLSPRPYYVMGPLLFLVLLVPFTINGLAVREAFFVSFLGRLGVSRGPAFATGFLFFVVTITLSLPGRGDPRLGGPRALHGRPSRMTERRRRPSSSSRTTRCRGSSSASRACRGYETVVVDHGSTDGTLELVRERFPDVRLVEQENRGLGAGWNRGMRETTGRVRSCSLNADAWALGDAVERLVAFADAQPRAAVVGPRLLNTGRVAAALGARLPDAVAARDRVPLPAQARAALARS